MILKHKAVYLKFVWMHAALLITCHSGCMRVRVQSSGAKGQGALVSTDEISRIMELPAVMPVLRPSCHTRSESYAWNNLQPGSRGGYRQNEWREFKGKIRDVFALLNGVEKRAVRNLQRWRKKCPLHCELECMWKGENLQLRQRVVETIEERYFSA